MKDIIYISIIALILFAGTYVNSYTIQTVIWTHYAKYIYHHNKIIWLEEGLRSDGVQVWREVDEHEYD